MAYIAGDTVILSMQFADENDKPFEVDSVMVNIYDKFKAVIDTSVTPVRTGVGKYIHLYQLPMDMPNVTVEFIGLYNGSQYLHRKEIEIVWSENF